MLKHIIFCLFAAAPLGANAATWTLDGDNSRVAFGSVKKNIAGESHSFSGLTGSVDDAGMVEIAIDLTSVETNIDIRNERMQEHVFGGSATATLSATVDMEVLNALAVGGSDVVEAEGSVTLLGTEVEIYADMFVMRLSESQVMVQTNDMIWIRADDLEIMAGLDKLMELAELPGITRTSPVTMRLMFNQD